MIFRHKPMQIPRPGDALPGRDSAMRISGVHRVNGSTMLPPYPEGTEVVYFGMGCFWGAERVFWSIPGVYTTAVGYVGGHTPNPTYEEVCSGMTGHTEAVLVVYDPDVVPLEQLLKTFWEEHDPTQGMRQANDVGTQYRSAIYWTTEEQRQTIEASARAYGLGLRDAGYGTITTELAPSGPFYFAEEYHQQYLDKNPNGYCGLQGTGVSCSI